MAPQELGSKVGINPQEEGVGGKKSKIDSQLWSMYGVFPDLGGSSCRVKNDRKGRKMTGFKKHQMIIILMDISGPSRTNTVKEIFL